MALRRISSDQIHTGMFVHAFEGSWLSHPFWRSRFLVEDERTAATIRESALDAVVIDTERGRDIEDIPVRAVEPAAAAPAARRRMSERDRPAFAAPSPPPRAPAAPRPAAGLAREFGQARKLEDKARKVISRTFLEARLGKAPKIEAVVPVVEDIFASIQRNASAFSGLMRCKSDAEGLYRHMLSTCALMVGLARQLGMTRAETIEAGLAGLLMDVGVSQLALDPDGMQGRIRDFPEELFRRHVFIGHDMLSAAGELPAQVLACVLHHHERLDGTGYPQRLAERDIGTLSRMAAICDSFDNLVSGAWDGQPVDPAQALTQMGEDPGAFDATILARFVETFGVYPVGSFVTLRSGRLAMVVDQDGDEPELPVVRAFYSIPLARHVEAVTIALATCFGEDAIEGVADLEELGLPPPQALSPAILAAAAKG